MKEKQITTDLQIGVSVLQNYADGLEDYKYLISYSPSRLIYMDELMFCNDFIREYAFKERMVNNIEDVIKDIKEVYRKSSNYALRVDVLFGRRDISHLSKERRYDCDGLIILNKDNISYNRSLSEAERLCIYNDLRNSIFKKASAENKANTEHSAEETT